MCFQRQPAAVEDERDVINGLPGELIRAGSSGYDLSPRLSYLEEQGRLTQRQDVAD